jgi:uncharacterized protein (TIGR02145 family)
MKTLLSVLLLNLAVIGTGVPCIKAQVCDPSSAPGGLASAYVPGSGALLSWNAVPGSVGVQIKASLPSGSVITRRIIGFERDQFAVPDLLLTPGTYTWQVQAACSTTFPYDVTPISAPSTFTVGSACGSTVTDVDGNAYSTVLIGSQCWLGENLKTEHYRNGDPIPSGLNATDWQNTTSGASTIPGNNPFNISQYGLLYNWFAVVDSRGLCPVGWHVPSDAEFTQLTSLFGGETLAGGPLKQTGTLGTFTGLWQAPNTGATDGSGFTAIPAGYRTFSGTHSFINFNSYQWTNTGAPSTTTAYFRQLYHNQVFVTRGDFLKNHGMSVRCLQD